MCIEFDFPQMFNMNYILNHHLYILRSRDISTFASISIQPSFAHLDWITLMMEIHLQQMLTCLSFVQFFFSYEIERIDFNTMYF